MCVGGDSRIRCLFRALSPILGPSRLKLLAKQTVNPGAGGPAWMWIGAGSSQVGDYLIPLRGFALPFLSHKH